MEKIFEDLAITFNLPRTEGTKVLLNYYANLAKKELIKNEENDN